MPDPIQLCTGDTLDLDGPIPLEAIEASLHRQPRFAGQTRDFFSVAQHCYHVYALAEDEPPLVRMVALLHDAAEAFMGDLPSPLKRLVPDYVALERKLLDTILRQHVPGYDPTLLDRVHPYDIQARRMEASLLPEPPDWAEPLRVPIPGRPDLAGILGGLKKQVGAWQTGPSRGWCWVLPPGGKKYVDHNPERKSGYLYLPLSEPRV